MEYLAGSYKTENYAQESRSIVFCGLPGVAYGSHYQDASDPSYWAFFNDEENNLFVRVSVKNVWDGPVIECEKVDVATGTFISQESWIPAIKPEHVGYFEIVEIAYYAPDDIMWTAFKSTNSGISAIWRIDLVNKTIVAFNFFNQYGQYSPIYSYLGGLTWVYGDHAYLLNAYYTGTYHIGTAALWRLDVVGSTGQHTLLNTWYTDVLDPDQPPYPNNIFSGTTGGDRGVKFFIVDPSNDDHLHICANRYLNTNGTGVNYWGIWKYTNDGLTRTRIGFPPYHSFLPTHVYFSTSIARYVFVYEKRQFVPINADSTAYDGVEVWISDDLEHWERLLKGPYPSWSLNQYGCSAVYDKPGNQLYLWNGNDQDIWSGNDIDRPVFTYDLSSNEMTERSMVPTTPTRGFGLAYDEDTDVVWTFGGYQYLVAGEPDSDFVIDRNDLLKFDMTDPFPIPVLFQQRDSGFVVYNESTDLLEWSRPPGRPDRRSDMLFVLDKKRKLIVMFGGRQINGRIFDDTWIYDIAGDFWYEDIRTPKPLPRFLSAAVYSPISDCVIMYGGSMGWGQDNSKELWKYTHDNGWEEIPIPDSVRNSGLAPTENDAAYSIGFTLDEETDVFYLFGGNTTPFGTATGSILSYPRMHKYYIKGNRWERVIMVETLYIILHKMQFLERRKLSFLLDLIFFLKKGHNLFIHILIIKQKIFTDLRTKDCIVFPTVTSRNYLHTWIFTPIKARCLFRLRLRDLMLSLDIGVFVRLQLI
jgi:hypothetical protein